MGKAQATASPRHLRVGGVPGQASSELLLILGAVLVVGLVVIGLFMFYAGTSEEKTATASAAYWSRAQPIAIRETSGRPTGDPGYVAVYPGGVYLAMKNIGKETIIIRAIDFQDSISANIWTKPRLIVGLDWAAQHIGQCSPTSDSDCAFQDNTAHNCNFVLEPSEEIVYVIQPQIEPMCSGIDDDGNPSLNSIRKSVSAPISIWYERNGVVQLQKGAVDLYVLCEDYLACSTDADCSRYSCSNSCYNGLCKPGPCQMPCG